MLENLDSNEIEKVQEKKNLRSPSLFLNPNDNYYKNVQVFIF